MQVSVQSDSPLWELESIVIVPAVIADTIFSCLAAMETLASACSSSTPTSSRRIGVADGGRVMA
jgi:hypothetical protein